MIESKWNTCQFTMVFLSFKTKQISNSTYLGQIAWVVINQRCSERKGVLNLVLFDGENLVWLLNEMTD